ncbi:MAG TPA: DUF4054 domain-containing protein [Ramlibacter sp.]|jgi:hypothetical protein
MPYSQPSAADFKVRFPGFGSVADTTINAVLDEAIAQIGESWIEDDRRAAQLYLTAHLLIMEGQPAASAAAALGVVSQGQVKRVKVGDVETEFTGGGSNSGSTGQGSGLSSTEYGRRYLQMLRRSFPSPLVV